MNNTSDDINRTAIEVNRRVMNLSKNKPGNKYFIILRFSAFVVRPIDIMM